MATPRLAIDRGRVRLAETVLVYLERTLAASEPLPPGTVPRPHGLAPVAIVAADGDAVLAAIGPGEAIWLGFEATDPRRRAIVRVRAEGSPPRDAVTGEGWRDAVSNDPRNHLVCPPDYCLAGLRVPTGYVPFGYGELTLLACDPKPRELSIRIVDPQAFAEATGREPQPLDPESAYKGWRLP